MLALRIGHACHGCGNCEHALPGVREEIKRNGYILANPHNPDCDWQAITDAVNGCDVGAFILEQFES